MYFTAGDGNAPDSPGVYDLAGSTGVFRLSRMHTDTQPTNTSTEKQNDRLGGWSPLLITVLSLIVITLLMTMGISVSSLLDGKLY